MTLPLALVCLGVLGFVGFVLWLRARYPKRIDIPPELAELRAAVRAIDTRWETRVVNLEEWKSNMNLAAGLRRKPEDRA